MPSLRLQRTMPNRAARPGRLRAAPRPRHRDPDPAPLAEQRPPRRRGAPHHRRRPPHVGAVLGALGGWLTPLARR